MLEVQPAGRPNIRRQSASHVAMRKDQPGSHASSNACIDSGTTPNILVVPYP
jgi:hypothetical protein